MIDRYIELYGRRLYGLCLTLCANASDADDLYQDTWLKVLSALPQYDRTREFEPWLTKICVNTYRNRLRQISRSRIFNNFSDNEEKDALLESVAAPPDTDYTELRGAIERLPDKLRIAVILFYFRDMDIASAAEVLDIPAGTVKSRLNKSRKLLKEALGDEADIQF